MLTFNKKSYQCNPLDYSPFRHDEYNTLKLFPIIGKLERYSGLLYDLAEIVDNPTLYIFGLKYSSFMSYECHPHFNKIYIINDNDEIQDLENTITNLSELKIDDKVEIINNDNLNFNTEQIVFLHQSTSINQNEYINLLLQNKPILLTTFDQTLKDNYTHTYKLSNSDYYLYLNDTVHERFLKEFHYYLKDNELDYDNLINLCIMVKNGGDDFKEMLIRNLPIIDRWTILDTGSTDGTLENINNILVGKKKGKLYQEPFINFRESRNRCLELAGMKCKYNLMLDDTYVIEGELRDFLNTVRSDQFADSFSLLIKSNDTEYYSNRITITQYKLRYIYTIHEVIQGHNNVNVVIPSHKSWILDLRSDYMEKRTMDRKRYDLQCLFDMVEEEPDNPRHLYYIAQTYNLLEDYEKAAEWFYKRAFHPNEGFDQEKIDALFEMTRMYNFKLNKPWNECEKWYKLVHEWDPERPEASYFIGIHYYLEGDKQTAFEYMKRGFQIGFPIHRQYSLKPTLSYHFLPKFLAELCYMFNDYELGQKACELFLQHNKPHEDQYQTIVDYYNIFRFANRMEPLQPTPSIPDKKIFAFVADGGFKKWSGSSIVKEGVGGSETYIIEMARYIAKHTDYEVVVFCNCENPEIFENVKYIELDLFFHYVSRLQIEHCVISRFSEYIMPAVRGYVNNIHLVVHDLTMSGNMIPFSNKLKNIFCLTEWHCSYFSSIFKQLSPIVSPLHYGIDFKNFIFREYDKKIPHSFIYSSFANRGLIVLLKMWPRILQKYPDATLNIFADLNNQWANTHYKEELAEIRRMMNEEYKDDKSITLHGWVSKETLGRYWRMSDVWFYPCKFKETFCLTALEAALSRTFAITNNLAALENTVGDRGVAIDGDVLTQEWQNRAFSALCSYMDSNEKNLLVEKNYQWALTHSWEAQALKLLDVVSKSTSESNAYNTFSDINNELTDKLLVIENVGRFIGYKGDYITNYISNHGDWEAGLNNILKQYITDKSTVIDIGAYIGTHTVKMSKLAKKVLSFEPFKKTFDILNTNLLINDANNVELYNCALGNENKKIDKMWFPKMDLTNMGLNMGSLRINRDSGLINDCVIVDFEMKRLDDIINRDFDGKIDLIKVDAEGCENDILDGAMNLIVKHCPVIIIENWKKDDMSKLTNLGYILIHKFGENCVYKLLDKFKSNGLNYGGMYNWSHDLPPNTKTIFENVLLRLRDREHCELLEVGCYAGTSMIKMLELLPNANGTTIDRWMSYSETTTAHGEVEILANMETINVEQIYYDNVKFMKMENRMNHLKGDSCDILLKLIKEERKFDFIYIDGSHKCIDCYADCLLGWQLLKSNGIMAIDDYLYDSSNRDILEVPLYGVEHFLNRYKNEYIILDKGYRVFIQKK
jgi:FkbM family methyltransferase